VDQKILPFRTRVNELLIGYGVTMGVFDSFLDVCDCIFPFGIDLGLGGKQKIRGAYLSIRYLEYFLLECLDCDLHLWPEYEMVVGKKEDDEKC
jgi:hypothetical protein